MSNVTIDGNKQLTLSELKERLENEDRDTPLYFDQIEFAPNGMSEYGINGVVLTRGYDNHDDQQDEGTVEDLLECIDKYLSNNPEASEMNMWVSDYWKKSNIGVIGVYRVIHQLRPIVLITTGYVRQA